MRDDIRSMILGIVKGSVLLIIAGVVFYTVYPKFFFKFQGITFFRCNQITGEIDRLNDDGNWERLFKENTK